MEELFEAILRTIIGYIILLFVTYLLGRRMATHLNYHSFAVAVTIGSIIANMSFEIKLNFLPIVASFFTLSFFFFLTSYISFKNVSLRKYLSGKPIILIEQGKIHEQRMAKAKYTLDDLKQQAREQGTFQLEEIETAVLEVSGKLSILLKPEYKSTVKKDIKQFEQKKAIELILNGKILMENLPSSINQDWIKKQCLYRNLKIEQVSYAVLGSNGVFYVMK